MSSEFYVDDALIEMSMNTSFVVQLTDQMFEPANLVSSMGGLTKRVNEQVIPGENQIIAAILTVLFGWIAVHRVNMGSTPLMILWYCITCGGIFLTVPIIDLLKILNDGTDRFIDSDKFFSW